MLRSLVAVAAVVAVSLPLTASGNLVRPRLDAKVTARSISLTMNGQRVRVLQPNSYRIVVKDSSKAQNFHLVGTNGMDLKTKIAATGTRVWSVYLGPGTYAYSSDKNVKLRGTFKVRGVPPA
jgi:hypothetical protein